MKRIALISITLLILIIGISCASAAAVDHGGNSTLKKDSGSSAVKINSSSLKAISKNTNVKNSIKKSSNNTVKSNSSKKRVRPCDRVINGWDPKKHQVSSVSIGNGLYRITYDDGYFRIVDSEGNILSYGY